MHLPPAALRLLLWLAALLPLSADAWNAAGHRISAAIAWQQLGDGERAAVLQLLAAHPDAARWERRLRPGDERGLVLLTEASTWADDIRRDRRFFDPGRETETPLLPGFPEMERHRDWHFLNLPVGGKPRRDADGQLDRQIRRLAERLADRRGQATERAWALVWLLHLVADLHQPLHVGTRIDADGNDDAGGNGLAVIDPDNSRRPETTLHAFWDDLPGPPWLRGPRLLAAAERLRHGKREPAAGEALDPDRWRDESYRLAQTRVYPAGSAAGETAWVLDTDYRRNARRIADERLAIAGIRLGRLLAALLSAP